MPGFVSLAAFLLLFDSEKDAPSNAKSFIGIVVAICGNVLISLALNCQKLAHRHLEEQREDQELEAQRAARKAKGLARRHSGDGTIRTDAILLESEPLLNKRDSNGIRYDGTPLPMPNVPISVKIKSNASPPKLTQRLSTSSARGSPWRTPIGTPTEETLVPIAAGKVQIMAASSQPNLGSADMDEEDEDEEQEDVVHDTGYLKSKLWWFGFFLMNVGEIGNFLSYGFAPASVVAPLGAFALIANCLFAPLILQERFHKSDLLGMILAIFGAATIVASAKPSSPHLNPSQLIEALMKKPFVIYSLVVITLLVLLIGVSGGKAGKKLVLIDIGICALFGGFTVLSTKAASMILSMEWAGIFKEWITYPIIVVLVGTGVGQIRYLNKALMKFDAKKVIPTQFVFFNLSAIVGSAILYGDFEKVNFHQFITFLYGCMATFGGVYLLTRGNDTIHGETRTPIDAEAGRSSSRLPDIPEELTRGEISPRPSRKGSGPIRILQRKASAAAIGISPGQYLLLAAPLLSTTPREIQPGSLERDRRHSLPASRNRSTERPASVLSQR